MNKLWVFGCSISDLYDTESSITHWDSKEYMEWKGYVPNHYSQIIAKELGYELINKAVSANSNYQILQDFCDSVPNIGDNDFIIIQWSSQNRIRLVDDNDNWVQFAFHSKQVKRKLENFSHIEFKSIQEILTNRLNFRYTEEILSWEKLIKSKFNSSQLLMWKPFEEVYGKNSILKSVELIKDETKGKIFDWHFSENGQIKIASILLNKMLITSKNII